MDKYSQLKEMLDKSEWPQLYMFKFIFKDNIKSMALLESIFSETAEISYKESKNGNYLAVTIKELCMCSDDVIDRYLQVEKIDGVISL
jgi:uncharacterized protein